MVENPERPTPSNDDRALIHQDDPTADRYPPPSRVEREWSTPELAASGNESVSSTSRGFEEGPHLEDDYRNLSDSPASAPTAGASSAAVASAVVLSADNLTEAAEIEHLVDELRGNEDRARRAVSKLMEIGTAESIRALVCQWAAWIALGTPSQLVEHAAHYLRKAPEAVLPVLDLFETGIALDVKQLNELVDSVKMSSGAVVARRLKNEPSSDATTGDSSSVHVHADPAAPAPTLGQLAALMMRDVIVETTVEPVTDLLEEVRRSRPQRRLRLRLARHLAEMSDPRYFQDDPERQTAVETLLEVHVRPVLARRLMTEDDLKVRESIARILGNLGGSESVDALVRAVVGEERIQVRRERLLERYYLEPARHQSEQAGTILKGAIDKANATFELSQKLNRWFFNVALLLLLVGVFVVIFRSDPGQLSAPGLSIAGGSFVGLLVRLVGDPMKRVQVAMKDLARVETVFTHFIYTLNLNGGFLQTRYVFEGKLDEGDVERALNRNQQAMEQALRMLKNNS